MKKISKIAICALLFAIQIILCWCIDISISSMLQHGLSDATLTNGFGELPSVVVYHTSLYGLLFSFFFMFLLIVQVILKKDEEKESIEYRGD